MMCSFATLDYDSLGIVRGLESETGNTILAYDCFLPEEIGEESVNKIREAEQKLCRTLMAVKTEHSA